jgi:DNA-binding YbaB/EbfC family protein
MSKGMKGLLKQAQKMQKEMQKAQEELAGREFEGAAGGGLVTVKLNGQMEVTAIKIKPEAADPDDVEMLEDLIMAAMANARGQATQASSEKFSGLTGGMNIPGL